MSCEPTLDRAAGWYSNGLIQGWNTSDLAMDNYVAGLADGAAGELAVVDGKRLIVPSVWGTEAIVYSKTDAPTTYGQCSLGDLWADKYVGKVCVRPIPLLRPWAVSSIPRASFRSPGSPATRTKRICSLLWDIALAEAIKHKANIAQFWNGENDAQAAYRTNGAVIGLNWDSTGYNLRNDGFGFLAPKEGAFAWNQGFVLMANAKNVDAGRSLREMGLDGRRLGRLGDGLLGQSGRQGRHRADSPEVKTFYATAYPGDALQKLWWWPVQEAWFIKLRGEYADKCKAA